MNNTTRRDFLKTSTVAGLGLAFPHVVRAAAGGPSDTVRLGVIGMGATEAVGGVGGRGHQLIARIQQVPGAKIVALCDVEPSFLARELQPFKDRGETVATYTDMRRMFEDKNVDAVVIALPNHWHALSTIWACQAGKDVYVEKPISHNLWEGRQMIAAARKYGRMVQVGTQNRSSPLLDQVFTELRRGELGRPRFGHAIMYRARVSLGKVATPTPPPASVDYDLWCGPAPKAPLRRKQLHYEWHWFWDTGNGEIANNGVHMMDLCRWGLGGLKELPRRTMSIGGRFAFDDSAETANTQIALMDYPSTPMICEIRNIGRSTPGSMGNFRGRTRGLLIDYEGGYFAGEATGGAIFDRQGKKIRDVKDDGSAKKIEAIHIANFLSAVRSRRHTDLISEAQEGHYSVAGAHMANISHRIGAAASPDEIRERSKAYPDYADAWERCRQHLAENGVDLAKTPATLGPWVTFDAKQERFVGEFAEAANRLYAREYRAPYVVPANV